MIVWAFKILLCSICAVESVTLSDFYLKRQRLLKDESQSFLGSDLSLTLTEYFANAHLMKMKRTELDQYFDGNKSFPLSHSFIDTKGDIQASEVFKFISGMPKGGALHLHVHAMTSAAWIVSNLTYRPGIFMCQKPGQWMAYAWFATEENTLSWDNCTWERISAARQMLGNAVVDDNILRSIQFSPDTFVHGDLTWAWSTFEKMIGAVSQITNLASIFEDFMYQAYSEFLQDNVQYIEFRTTLHPVCKVAMNEGCLKMNRTEMAFLHKSVNDKFMSNHPTFCGSKLIYSPYRRSPNADIQASLKLLKSLMEKLPGFVIGFDLVGQEDLGKPLVDFVDLLLGKNFPYYFHAGETNWQGQSTDTNLIDAMLLGAKRIGHGYAIVKHPRLKLLAKLKNIALEVCPISNQMLGLLTDLRNHPAASLIQENQPLVISSDDPSPFGAKGLSYDFYAAFMAMSAKDTMDLRLLKKLVINSMDYSDAGPRCKKLVDNNWMVYMEKFMPTVKDVVQTLLGEP